MVAPQVLDHRIISRSALEQCAGQVRLDWHHRRYIRLLKTYISMVVPAIEYGKFDELLEYAKLARSAAEAIDRYDLVLYIDHSKSVILQRKGEPAEALRVAEGVEEEARATGSAFRQAQASATRAQILRDQEHFDDSLTAAQLALQIYRDLAASRSEAQALGDIANTYDDMGNTAAAYDHYTEALRSFASVGDYVSLSRVHWDFALSAWRAGDTSLASTHRAFSLACLIHAHLYGIWLRQGFDWINATSFAQTHSNVMVADVSAMYSHAPRIVQIARDQHRSEEPWRKVGELLHPSASDPFTDFGRLSRLHRNVDTRGLLTSLQRAANIGEYGKLPYMIADLRKVAQLTAESGRTHARSYVRKLRPNTRKLLQGLRPRHRTVIEQLTADTPIARFRNVIDEISNTSRRLSLGEHLATAFVAQRAIELTRTKGDETPDWAISSLRTSLAAIGGANGDTFVASCHIDLGSSYRLRSTGDPADNLERAIAHLRYAVQLLTPANSESFFTRISGLNALGNAYLFRVRGDRYTNLVRARNYLRAAVETATVEDAGDLYGVALQNLALVHDNLSSITGSQDCEVAIALYQNALATLADENGTYAMSALMNLSDAYRKRAVGDPVQNTELALQYARKAKSIADSIASDRLVSQTESSLASIYAMRGIGDRHANIQYALDLYESALARVDSGDLVAQAVILGNMGNAYQAQSEGDRDRVLETAAQYLEQSRDLWSMIGDVAEYGRAVHNLANCCLEMWHETGRESRLTASIELYCEAISSRHAARDIRGVIESQFGYAEALSQIDDESAQQDTISILQEVLRDSSGTADDLRLEAARMLGQHFAAEGAWDDACQVLDTAVAIQEHGVERSSIAASRRKALVGAGATAQLYAFCLVQAGAHRRAIQVIERYRGRLLSDEVARSDGAIATATAGSEAGELNYDSVQAISNLRAANALLFDLDVADIDQPGDERSIFHLWGVAEESTHVLSAGETDPDSWAVSGVAPGNGLADDEAFIYMAVTSVGSLLCKVSRSDIASETFAFDEAALGEVLIGDESGSIPGYFAARASGSEESFREALERLCRVLGHWLSQSTVLFDTQHVRLRFIPCGVLAVLPLHAAIGEMPEGDVLLFESHHISYVPSARFATARRSLGLHYDTFVAFCNPDGSLPLSEEEVAIPAGTVADSIVFARQDASISAVERGVSAADIVHFGCHGRFIFDEPEESFLNMADGRLTVGEIHDFLRGSPTIVFAAACESALSDFFDVPDELVGLPAALLRVGARYVVGTQWRVDNVLASVFSTIFYARLLKEGMDVVQAVHVTTSVLRTSTVAELLREIPSSCTATIAALASLGHQSRPYANLPAWANFTIMGA